MTKFQALYVLYLRHEEFKNNSWRELSRIYYLRYKPEYAGNNPRLEKLFNISIYNGNQLDGMRLEEDAFKILRPDPLFMEPQDLYECDLTMLDIKLRESRLNKLKNQ